MSIKLKNEKTRNKRSLTLRLQNIHALKLVTKTGILNSVNLLKNDDAKVYDIENQTISSNQITLRHEVAHRERPIIYKLYLLGDLYDEVCLI
jgi:hypothetical protein